MSVTKQTYGSIAWGGLVALVSADAGKFTTPFDCRAELNRLCHSEAHAYNAIACAAGTHPMDRVQAALDWLRNSEKLRGDL